MDKSFLLFVLAGIGFLYLTISFIGDVQEGDESFRSSEYEQKHKYDKYHSVDSIGRDILDLTGIDASTQASAWNESRLREEFLELFPDFDLMKTFAEERIRGEVLQSKLLDKVNDVESRFFSGSLNPEQAKRELSELK